MEFKDYYRTLGISQNASEDEIKKAFRKLARKYHPDVSKEPDAEQKIREINEAYAVLSDPEKRAAYEQLSHGYQPGQDFRPPPGWDTGFEFSNRGFSSSDAADYSDFFAELFGHMGGGRAAHARAGHAQRGEDHHAKVLLDLEDSFTGPTRQISLRLPQLDAHGRVLLVNRTLNLKIPLGIFEGQIIRLAGQGGPGLAGGVSGDLLLEVHFNPDSRLRVEGRELHRVLPVSPWEAALGAVIPIRLPGGVISVRLPPGSQSGRILRVRGKGIPANPPGDLLLEIQVLLPAADTPKAKQIYEDMARELAFDPRRGE
jgi:curved DNA-binding protein